MYSKNKYNRNWKSAITGWVEERTLYQNLVRRGYDYLSPFTNMARTLKENGNLLNEDQDVIAHIKVAPGKTKFALMENDRKFFRDLKRVMKHHKISVDMLDEFLYSLHGRRRNEVLLRSKKKDDGSGLSNRELEALERKYKNHSKRVGLERASSIIHSMLDAQLNNMVDYGLIDEKTRNIWKKKWGPEYIPLKDEDARGITVEALGRSRKAWSPTSHAMAQSQWTIIKGVQNAEINQSVLNLVRNFKGPWKDITTEVVTIDPTTGQEIVTLEATSRRNSERVFKVMEKGKPVYIEFTGTEGLMAARALKRMDVESASKGIKFIGDFTRFYGGMLTSFNLAFTIPNLSRDIGMAMGNLMAEGHGTIARRSFNMAEMVRNHQAVRRYLRSPEGVVLSPELQIVEEFFQDGGSVEQFGVGNPLDIYTSLEKDLKRSKGTEYVVNFFKWIETENKVMENMMRFSAYKHARELGMS
ncbi:MAG: hypothetical protein GWN31_10665, partial [Candidatus Thorarchaeota archaeon]|nr:hypothetical protein [Candidatus Thorarchaeota archaeon]